MSLGTDLDALERGKRARTLGSVVQNVTTALVVGIALLMVLRLLDLDIAPVLTGAGIAGLAVGFGAQTLVRDIISGFFLILEDQVRVGDAAAINGTDGMVEAINLRTIVAARHRGHRARLPERRDQHAGESQQGLLVLRHRSVGVVLRRHRSDRGGSCARSVRHCRRTRRSGRPSSRRLRSSGSMRSASGR